MPKLKLKSRSQTFLQWIEDIKELKLQILLSRKVENKIRTHKHTLGFPFTFAVKKISDKQKGIEEKGHLSTFWAKSKVRKQNKIQYAACYRNGLGRVALLYTTVSM
jgi:hypothetical protein